jgi:hypothetical protein
MGFLDRNKNVPVVLKPITHHDAIVISTDDVLNILGEPREVIPSNLVRAVGMAMPAAERVVDSLSGRIVRLTDRSMEMLRTQEAIVKNGVTMAVVRDPATKQFTGMLTFEKLNLSATALSSLPALAAGVALQMQLARIEKKLGEIEGKLDYVIRQGHLQIEARVLAALHILDDVAADALPSGFVDDDAWDQLSEIRDDVLELQKWASLNLAPLSRALVQDELSIASKVRILTKALKDDRAMWWIKARIAMEATLLRWEQLYLIRRAWTTPDELDAVTARVEQHVLARRHELVELRNGLQSWLDRGSKSDRVLDRLRVIQKVRLKRLLEQLPPVVDAYPPALTRSGNVLDSKPTPAPP